MSGSKARHSTLQACATPGRSESLAWDSLPVNRERSAREPIRLGPQQRFFSLRVAMGGGFVAGATLDLGPPHGHMNPGFRPTDVLNPRRGDQNLWVRQSPGLGVDHHVAHNPVVVVQQTILYITEWAVEGLDMIADDLESAS